MTTKKNNQPGEGKKTPYLCQDSDCVARKEMGGDHHHNRGWNEKTKEYYASTAPEVKPQLDLSESEELLKNWKKSIECGGCVESYDSGCGHWHVPEYLVDVLLRAVEAKTRRERERAKVNPQEGASNGGGEWRRYRFKTRSLNDYRPIVWNPKFPWWCSGEGKDYAIIIAYLPATEELGNYWPEAFCVESTIESKIKFSSRFPKPEYFDLTNTSFPELESKESEGWEKELAGIPTWTEFGCQDMVNLGYVLDARTMAQLKAFIRSLKSRWQAEAREGEGG